MSYFVTGGTGFIGRFLIDKLVKREGTIHVLVRKGSVRTLDELRSRWGTDGKRVVPVVGDLAEPNLGLSPEELAELRGDVKHVFHLAALYDLSADAESLETANTRGTRHAIQFAASVAAGCFHHVSSIAAAGLYHGTFREDMFEEAAGLAHPYFRTKHDSEGAVRNECARPWRVYRPAIVVGHSRSGEIHKVDGPYYFFRLIKKRRNALPPWMPVVGIEGGHLNIVPVDFVVDALDYIAHKEGLDGGCFHLTDPEPRRIGEVMNLFAKAANAPPMTMRLNTKMFSFIPSFISDSVMSLPPVRRILSRLGIPKAMFMFVNYPTRFDSRGTQKALEGTGIEVPRLEDYAARLWNYWERHLDPDTFAGRPQASGMNVVVTRIAPEENP